MKAHPNSESAGSLPDHLAIATMENYPAPAFWIDESGAILFVNQAASEALGYSQAELAGMSIAEIDPAFRQERWPDHWKALLERKELRFESVHRTRDGRDYPVEIWANRVEIDGRIINCAFAFDVSARREMEEELRTTLTRLGALIQNIQAALLVEDEQRRIVLANQSFCRLFGVPAPPDQLVGADCSQSAEQVKHLFEDPEGFVRRIAELLEQKTLVTSEELLLADGRVLERDYIPVVVAEHYRGHMWQYRDISERKRAARALERSRDDLVAVLNGLREGAAIVDGDGHVAFVNHTAAELFGTSLPEARGRPWPKVFVLSETHQANLELLLQSTNEQAGRAPIEVVSPGGRRHVVELQVQADPRAAGRKLVFFYDITESHNLRHILDERATFQELVGRSPSMRKVYEQIEQVAPLDWTVLVTGATGTGKELVARAIHSLSHRKTGPFVAVNCAALSEALLASQLFGHRRGAFTGAVSDQKGLFEAANDGTIFLDEIGDMPASIQTSLLRVIQEREILRLGESRPRPVNVRVVTATHRDLQKSVQEGSFREDLLYRIRGFIINLPLLRERREDIPLLVRHFAERSALAIGKEVREISDGAMRLLLDYTWPGNVRELQSAVEFAAVRSSGGILRSDDLPPEIHGSRGGGPPGSGGLESADPKGRILDALARAGGNRSQAAKLLGISRATLYRRLSELDIRPPGPEPR